MMPSVFFFFALKVDYDVKYKIRWLLIKIMDVSVLYAKIVVKLRFTDVIRIFFQLTLHEKRPYSEFLWPVFSRIRTK